VQGILADNNVIGQVAHLVERMQAEPWADYWLDLRLVLRRFERDYRLTDVFGELVPAIMA